jgi:hypothetical protein
MAEKPVRLFTDTVTGSYVAPDGTTTFNEVVVAEDIVALTFPKKTILFAGTGLKLEPAMITDVPIGPEVGAKELITGWENKLNDKGKKTIMKAKQLLLTLFSKNRTFSFKFKTNSLLLGILTMLLIILFHSESKLPDHNLNGHRCKAVSLYNSIYHYGKEKL